MIHQSQVDVLCEQVEQIMQQFAVTANVSSGDFTLVEEAARQTILKLRPVMMSAGLELSAASFKEEYACPKCHRRLRGWRMPARTVMTAQGEATYSPLRYRCKPCGKDYYPLEEANSLSGCEFTAGAKAAIAEVAAERPFAHTASSLGRERGLFVSAKEVDRTAREVADWRLEEEHRLTDAAFGTEAAILRSEERDPMPQMPALHPFQRWGPGEVAQISVDGARHRYLRSTVRGPSPEDGLEWFECRAGMIAPQYCGAHS